MQMIIAVTGTPGTGKTAVAKALAKELGANLISLSSLLKKGKIPSAADKGRKTRVVGIADVISAVRKSLKKGKTNIVDGHLSHLAGADMAVVLRCRPDVLERRLKKRRWPRKKIIENIHAEILDAVTIEAVEACGQGRVVEIDTTGKSPGAVAAVAEKVLNNHALQRKYAAGGIDWSEKFAGYLKGR